MLLSAGAKNPSYATTGIIRNSRFVTVAVYELYAGAYRATSVFSDRSDLLSGEC